MNTAKKDSQIYNSSEIGPEIRWAPPATLALYTISESELETIAKGGFNNISFPLCIFFFSVAISIAIALITTTILSQIILICFIVAVIVGIILGIFFLIVSIYFFYKSNNIVEKVRSRMPPEGVQEKNTVGNK